MNLKEIGKMPEKHNEGYNAMDGTRGMEAAFEKGYDNLIKVQDHIKSQRKIIGMMAFITAVSVAGFIYKSATNPFVPYIVRISESGTINGQKLTTEGVSIDDNTMQFFLVDFIKKIRTIYKDRSYYDRQVADKMAFLTPEAKTKLESLFATKTDTRDIVAQGYTTTVTIDSFLKVEGNQKYQINYTENVLSQGGQVVKQSKYTTILTIGRTEVKNDAMVRMNPLGILITDIDLSMVSTTSSGLAPQQPQATVPQVNTVPPQAQPQQIQPQQVQPIQ